MAIILYALIVIRKMSYIEPNIIITFIILLIAPVIGSFSGQIGQEVSTEDETGFAGIPRVHFLWLWLPAYWYSTALIGPIYNIFTSGIDFWFISHIIRMIPIIAYAAPLYFGLSILSGNNMSEYNKVIRQTLGSLIILLGFWIVTFIHFYIYNLIVK